MNTNMSSEEIPERVKCLIIGSGPAGYTAAVYASRANLAPVLYTGLQMGGQLTTTTEVENFPGYPEGVSGPVLMEDMKKQAERFGTDIRFGIVTQVDFSGHPHKITVDDTKKIEADAVIVATGATARYLGLPSEEAYRGSGVSACATCDGFFYKNKDVAVVGGGDTACEEATYLAGLCRKVYLDCSKKLPESLESHASDESSATPNIEVLFEHNTVGTVRLRYGAGRSPARFTGKGLRKNATKEIKIDGFFLAIGHTPNTDIFKKYLQLDEQGIYPYGRCNHENQHPRCFCRGRRDGPHLPSRDRFRR